MRKSPPNRSFELKLSDLYSIVESKKGPKSRAAWTRSHEARRFKRLCQDREFVLELLDAALDDSAAGDRVRFAAEPVLRNWADDAIIMSHLTEALSARSTSRRRGAAWILSNVPSDHTVPALKRHARNSNDPLIRCLSLSALNICALTRPKLKRSVVELAIPFLRKRSRREQLAGLNTLELHGGPSHIKIIQPLLRSNDKLIQSTAQALYDRWVSARIAVHKS